MQSATKGIGPASRCKVALKTGLVNFVNSNKKGLALFIKAWETITRHIAFQATHNALVPHNVLS
jgi:hypothetical protein